jgi:hypothetical protein
MPKTAVAAALAALILVAVTPAAQTMPMPPHDTVFAALNADIQDAQWRHCWRDRWGRRRCQSCWRDRWGRVRCRRRPTSEAEFAERKASEVSDYERRLAAEIVAMLPEDREEAAMGLGYVEAILSLELPPPASTRAPHASC